MSGDISLYVGVRCCENEWRLLAIMHLSLRLFIEIMYGGMCCILFLRINSITSRRCSLSQAVQDANAEEEKQLEEEFKDLVAITENYLNPILTAVEQLFGCVFVFLLWVGELTPNGLSGCGVPLFFS